MNRLLGAMSAPWARRSVAGMPLCPYFGIGEVVLMRMRHAIDADADDDLEALKPVPAIVRCHLAFDQNAGAFLVREQQIVWPFEAPARRQRWALRRSRHRARQSGDECQFGRALDGRWIDNTRGSHRDCPGGEIHSPAMTPATAGLRHRRDPDRAVANTMPRQSFLVGRWILSSATSRTPAATAVGSSCIRTGNAPPHSPRPRAVPDKGRTGC